MIQYTEREIRGWRRIGASSVFGIVIDLLAKSDDRLVCVTADMSRSYALERFRNAHPDRFVNVGIAEENMIGVAAGLAMEGFNPFAFTQAAFATTRALDFIKVNLGYMGLPVKLVGLSAGLELGAYGATHISDSDIAQMRGIPGMTVVAPADCLEAAKAIEAISKVDTPAYVRLTGGENIVYPKEYDFQLGKAVHLREGADVAIISSGAQVWRSLRAAEILEGFGYSIRVLDMHTIKPLDTAAIDDCLNVRLIVTAEEHSIIGGLGCAVSEYLAPLKAKPPQLLVGLEDHYLHAGEYNWLVETAGLGAEAMATKISESLQTL